METLFPEGNAMPWRHASSREFGTAVALFGLLLAWSPFFLDTSLYASDDAVLTKQLGKERRVELRLKPKPQFVLQGIELKPTTPSSELANVLTVRVHRKVANQTDSPALPAVIGTYSLHKRELVFAPRFPLSREVTYLVEIRIDEATKENVLFRLPPLKRSDKTIVSAVYPSSNALPENLLKFYIHFSSPMTRGEAYEHISLWRGNEKVEQPFLELGEELWDREQIRFTLFIHPGRIKRGLRPREEEGPSLVEGGQYSLRINSQWCDADGLPLAQEFSKTFTVTPADHDQPNLEQWKIGTPSAESRQPITLTFSDSLDQAMLHRVLRVQNQFGKPIEGQITVEQEETVWSFVPNVAWEVGTYNVLVAANLEDRCGNSIARPFEVKMQQRAAARPGTDVAIEFIVK